MIEFGYSSFAPPFQGAALAREDEDLGFDLRYFGDNYCFHSDVFAELRDAARATSRIKLATGVTNTVTKHPSVVASSIAAVQVLSGGRAICGLGKGDSALGVIGLRPQRHDEFVERATMLRTYLQGGSVDLNGWDSRLQWLDDFADYEPVPLEVTCSGPRTLRAAATFADRITLAVGAAPERIAWALEHVDAGLADAGRGRDDVEIGALVSIAVDDDLPSAAERLRDRGRGAAHMASFAGQDLDAQPAIMRDVTERLRAGYDYRHHSSMDPANPLTQLVSPEFAAWWGIGGPAGYVVERLGELVDVGVGYFLMGKIPLEERARLVETVFPEVRKISV